MKYILFLQDLGLNREETRNLLRASLGDRHEDYTSVWIDDPEVTFQPEQVEIVVTSEHTVGARQLEPWGEVGMMVGLAFTGHNDVDKEYCRGRELELYYVPGYSTDSVAELTVGLTIAVLRKIPRADSHIRKGGWHWNGIVPGIELAGKTVGIVGTGTIGTRSAELFLAFGCRVMGWAGDHQKAAFEALGAEYRRTLSQLLGESDIVALHLPVTAETQGIIGRRELGLMKPTGILINTARSQLVDTEALESALRERSILGAGIDVFDDEPPSGVGGLFALDNVVLTPHLGFRTRESLDRLARITIENIGRYVRKDRTNRLEYEAPQPGE